MKQPTTRPANQAEVRELTDTELEQVCGGTIVLGQARDPKKVGRSTLNQPDAMVQAGKKLLTSL